MPAEGSWFWVEGMIDVFFYIDLVLNFFVAYEVRPRAACVGRTGSSGGGALGPSPPMRGCTVIAAQV